MGNPYRRRREPARSAVIVTVRGAGVMTPSGQSTLPLHGKAHVTACPACGKAFAIVTSSSIQVGEVVGGGDGPS